MDGGIVDQHIDSPRLMDDGFNHGPDFLCVAEVGFHGKQGLFAQLLKDFIRRLGVTGIMNNDPGSCLGEHQRRRFADPA